MEFLVFTVFVVLVIALIGFAAWLFAKGFVALTQLIHSAFACVASSQAVRPEQAVIPELSVEAVVAEPVATVDADDEPELAQSRTEVTPQDEPEVDWRQYDVPTYLRRGKVIAV